MKENVSGMLIVITGIPYARGGNRVQIEKVMEEKYTVLMLEEQKVIANKYGKEYSICHISNEAPIDMTIVPNEITIKKMNLPILHVIIEKTKENGE